MEVFHTTDEEGTDGQGNREKAKGERDDHGSNAHLTLTEYLQGLLGENSRELPPEMQALSRVFDFGAISGTNDTDE